MRLLALLPLSFLLVATGCSKPAEEAKPPVTVLVGEGSADPAALAAAAQQKAAPEASGAQGCGGAEMGSGHEGCGGGCGGDAAGSGHEGCGGGGEGCTGGCGKHKGECTKGADGKCACEGCKGCGGEGCCGGGEGEHMGCGGGGEDAAAKPAGAHEEDEMEELENVPADKIKAQPGLSVGDITRCPVSGEVFRIKANSPKAVVDGKTYYVCCKRCVGKFEKNPAKYTAK